MSDEAAAQAFVGAVAAAHAAIALELIDALAPGLVGGLHVVGSAALGDWQPGASDIDLLVVTQASLTAIEIAHLDALLPQAPYKVEALWIAEDELVAPPTSAMTAVALRTLAQGAITLRGEVPRGLWSDRGLLDQLLRENLDAYWRPWLAGARRPLGARGLAMLGGWASAWGVLGLARIGYTLATGDITSKTGGGRWALGAFPAHARIVGECLRLRTGEGVKAYSDPFTRRRDALAAMSDMLAE